jgi:hypothetical protein
MTTNALVALIDYHTTYVVLESEEVREMVRQAERRAAAQERFDTIGLPRCLAPLT